MAIATTPCTRVWDVKLWESKFCIEEGYFGRIVICPVAAQDRKDAIEQAFVAFFRERGEIMKPAKAKEGKKKSHFVVFVSGNMTNNCGEITIDGRYYLVLAISKRQAWAYINATRGCPEWVEQITAKPIKSTIPITKSVTHDWQQYEAELKSLCENCRHPFTQKDIRQRHCSYCLQSMDESVIEN